MDIRNFLAHPLVYEAFQLIVSRRKLFVNEYVRAKAGEKILDIGCGPGSLLRFLPKGVDYLGADLSESYISAARRKYGSRGRFVCQRVDKEVFLKDSGRYDLVLAGGLIHHLNDIEAQELFDIAFHALEPSGRFVALDGCYTDEQSALDRFIVSRDRGKFIRRPEAYAALARKCFPDVKVTLDSRLTRIPYSIVVTECVKP